MSTPPPSLEARLAEALALQRQGAAAEAGARLRALLAEAPDSPMVHKALASLAAQAGQEQVALEHMGRAVALAPDVAGLRLERGCLLAHFGKLAPALEDFRASVARQPGLAEAWYFLGITLARLHRDEEALAPLRRAHELAPANPRVLEARAQVEFRAGFPADALPLWQALAQARPGHVDTLLKLGETLGRLGHNEDARRLYRDALATQPDSPDLWMALAQSEEDNGDRDAAEAGYTRALALKPDWAFPLAGLLGLRRGKADEARVAQARRLMAGGTLADADLALVGYELGKVHDGRAEYPEAMAAWDAANAARRRQIGDFDLPALQGRVERSRQVFDAGLFARAAGRGSDDERPLFVVGMPRSGTTLTEQILGNHPLAFGCGELPDMALIARSLPSRAGTPQQWPHILEDIDPGALDGAIARYLSAATRHAPAGALRLVDKAPMNFYILGLVALMFPRARVVWCRRDPRDIAVSIYGENFSLNERFATSLEGIGHCIRLQEQLMRHWQAVLPLPILELDYEQLVGDLEPQARRLLDFAGLPWDASVLDFHRSERGVQTPSRWQVRQPVHTRSVGRWRNYEFAMGPLQAVLDAPGPG